MVRAILTTKGGPPQYWASGFIIIMADWRIRICSRLVYMAGNVLEVLMESPFGIYLGVSYLFI